MKNFFKPKYRVNRDSFYSSTRWAVEKKIWFWPFWCEHRDMLPSKEMALELKGILEEQQ